MPDGAGADDVVPIAGDSTTVPEGTASSAGTSPAEGAARPFISNDSFDASGYEALSAAVDELYPIYWSLPPPLPPDVGTDVSDVSDVSDVVPIAGDTRPPDDDVGMFGADGSYAGPGVADSSAPAGTPPSTASPPVDYSGIDDLIDEVLERLGAPPDEGLLPAPRPRDPWIVAAIVAAVVLIVAAVIAFALTGGSSSQKAEPAASTTAPSSTAPPTTTSASVPPSDVTLSLGLGQVSGPSLPLIITLQAAAAAPKTLTVKVAMAGPGIPASDTYQLNPGASVTHTVVVNGCGSWTVQVVSIDGQPVQANGNPNLQNGATHKC